jgi:SAM-dependent methyltransferase
MGGTAMYLADRFDARIVGITISPIQAAMAGQLAGRNRSGRCAFAAMDAEAMAIQDQFDIVWSVEALSHMPNRNRVLGDAIALLRPGGKVGVIDWFKAAASITPSDERAYLHPLERGMLVHHLSTFGVCPPDSGTWLPPHDPGGSDSQCREDLGHLFKPRPSSIVIADGTRSRARLRSISSKFSRHESRIAGGGL